MNLLHFRPAFAKGRHPLDLPLGVAKRRINEGFIAEKSVSIRKSPTRLSG